MSKSSTAKNGFRDQPDSELQDTLDRTRDELFRLRLGMHTNQVSSTASVGAKRKEIAQILTILRARGLGLETQAQSNKAK
jgi:ribosomal protein L29